MSPRDPRKNAAETLLVKLRRGLGREDGESRLAWLRHPLRILSTALALGCLVWPLTDGVGLGALLVGTLVGVVLGELAGRSAWRGWVVAAGAGVAFAALNSLAMLCVRVEWIARALGPTTALSVGVALRFFGFAALPVAALRAAAIRVRALVFLEVAACIAGLAFLVQSHRGGNLARPLWLGDYAWRAGLDPAVVLLATGTVAFLVMAAVLAAEHGRRSHVLSLLALPLLAWFVFTSFDVAHIVRLPKESERDHPVESHGEPPKAPPTGEKPDGGQGQPDKDKDSSDGGQGQPDKDKDPSDGGQGQPDKDKDSSDGRDSPPPEEPPPLDAPPPPDSPENQQPMAIVLLGDDYDPPGQMFYLRQESWSQFAENRLVPTTRPDADRDAPSEFPTRRQDVGDPPPPGARKLIHATVAMVLEHKKPFALETPVVMDVAPNPDPKRFARAYRFEALAQRASFAELLTAKAGNPAWSEELREYYTRPAIDPRYAALAHDITRTLDAKKRVLPLFQALSVKLWMDKNLTYSTRHRHADVADPAADFLFGDRIGYCVHFAHVAVYLWRSLGLPARIGMGYAVNAESREGSALMVKSGDGHAWPELYLEGAGWVVLDIAPQKNIDLPARPVDKELQRKLADMARKVPEEKPKDGPRVSNLTPKLVLPWRKLLLVLVSSTLAALYAIKAWRRLLPRFARAASLPRVGYRAALDMLSELERTRREGETREAFGRRVSREFPTFARVTDLHIEHYFGDPSRFHAERLAGAAVEWRRSLAALRDECRTMRHGPRAWLGRVNPASFLASK